MENEFLTPKTQNRLTIKSINLGLASKFVQQFGINQAVENFNFESNKVTLTTADKNEIKSRNRVVLLCYLGGNEGASMTQCLYSIHYLIYGVIKNHIEVVDLLKNLMISVVPAVNIEQLKYLED